MRSASTHLDRAESALRDGDLDTADRAYEQAGRRSEDNAWVRAEVRRGRARVALARVRRDLPGERNPPDPLFSIRRLHGWHVTVRQGGGDAELERELVARIDANAIRLLDALERGTTASYTAGRTLNELVHHQISPATRARSVAGPTSPSAT